VINTLQLKQAAGTLSPQDLVDLNNWLSEGARGIEAMAEEDRTLDDPTQ
jgi:outer membrane protein